MWGAWVCGCGCGGAWVWGGGIEMGLAGLRRDGDGASWMERRIELPGRPHPGFGLPARV